MAYALGVVVMVVGVVVSIALHELGHLIPAKKFGVLVPQYFVGFGPTLWSRRKGDTEYGIKAILLGGYVRLAGMYAPARPGAKPYRGPMAASVEAAREASAEELPAGQEHRALYALSAPKKTIVMLGGVLMNFLLAAVLMAVAFMGVGQTVVSTRLATVAECLVSSSSGVSSGQGAACTSDATPAPASEAGLTAGDTIVAIDGIPTPTWEDVQAGITASDGAALTITVERDGAQRTVTVTPAMVERQVTASDGTVTTQTAPYVGISPGYDVQRATIGETAEAFGQTVSATVTAVVQLPVNVWHAGRVALGLEERGDSSLVSIIGVGQIAGEATGSDAPGVPTAARVTSLLSLLASLNIALAVFNLIPLVPLDGGHVAGAIYEGIRRTWGRVTGKPWQGPADTARLVPLAYVMWIVLLVVAVVLIAADIIHPVVG